MSYCAFEYLAWTTYISSDFVAPQQAIAGRLCAQKQRFGTGFLELFWERTLSGQPPGPPVGRLGTFAWRAGLLRNPRHFVRVRQRSKAMPKKRGAALASARNLFAEKTSE